MTQIRAHGWVEGRVQGVYFRSHVAERAEALGVTGWVSNAEDGRVEVVAEGPRDAVESLISACRAGSPSSIVTDVKIVRGPATGQFKSFSVRR